MRTPLTILRGSLEVVLEEDRPSEEYREAIGNALLEVRHLTRLSQNLLFLTRGQSGRITLSFANIDLVKLLGEIARNLQPAINGHCTGVSVVPMALLDTKSFRGQWRRKWRRKLDELTCGQ